MNELRGAVTYEVTHDLLPAVTHTVSLLPDPRERISGAIRFYLHRVREALLISAALSRAPKLARFLKQSLGQTD